MLHVFVGASVNVRFWGAKTVKDIWPQTAIKQCIQSNDRLIHNYYSRKMTLN